MTLVPSMLTVLYATANHTALVVDCGWAETRLLPVFKGIPLPYLYQSKYCLFFLENKDEELTQVALNAVIFQRYPLEVGPAVKSSNES